MVFTGKVRSGSVVVTAPPLVDLIFQAEQAGCSDCDIEADFILIDVENMSCAVKKAALKLLCLGKLSEEYAIEVL
jgi:hypothetical protein